MTKEELKQKAEEYTLEKCKECYMCNSEENGERGYCPKYESRIEGYITGATEETKELEAQIEKMKCCGNCKYFKFVGESLKGNYQCLKDGDKGKYYRSCNNFENWEIRR